MERWIVEDHSWRRGVDENRPSPARVYDYFLGGGHNFAIDRQMAARLQETMPDIGNIMRANRDFLRRALGHLVDAGIEQFLDLGSGIPTVGNVHELVQRSIPNARVVYVDIDPVAVAHSTAILADNPHTGVIQSDLREVDRVLEHPVTTSLLDLSKPVALLIVGVLHQLPGADPGRIIQEYRRHLAPGSYLVLSQPTQDGRPEEAEGFSRTHAQGYQEAMAMRTKQEVIDLCDGFDVLDPGIVYLLEWRPAEPLAADAHPERLSTYAAVARLANPATS